MSHVVRVLERAIRAAEVERESRMASVTDITAYIRVLREMLENEEEPTMPDNPTIQINGAAPDNQAARIR